MSVNKILKITIMILFAFVFTDIARSCPECYPPTIISPNDNEVYLAGGTFTDLCKVYEPYLGVITWSGGGSFDPTTGSPVSWTAPETTGYVTITATNYCGSDQVTVRTADIIYVDEDATEGENDGTSWDDAFLDLQDGLDAASSSNHIWVGQGIYKPGTSRADTFQLVAGVEVYGGFDPCIGDDTWAERDYINNVTILSGDIDNDNVLNGNNSYNVVIGANNATIDGFTITKGYADDSSSPGYFGGGMYNISDPNITNCTFTDNYGTWGGGMANISCSPTVTHCTFSKNTAGSWGYGGGMYNNNSDTTVTNCIFSNNSANNSGGGMYNTNCSPTVKNCIFKANMANSGGGMGCNNETPSLTNCTLIGNVVNWNGGAITINGGHPTITNCILWGNKAGLATSSSNVGDEICLTTSTNLTISYSDIDGGWDGPKVLCIGDSGVTNGGGNINADPEFINIFDFADGTVGAGTTTTIKVEDASLYTVGNEIEYDNDGTPREVTAVDTGTDTVTFANDALSSSSVMGKVISNWGSGATDVDEDLHLDWDSPCIDVGDPSGTYTGEVDIDGDDRVIDVAGKGDGTVDVDMGADEFLPITTKGPYLIFTGTNTEMMVSWELNQDSTCIIEWGTTPSYGSSSQVDYDVTYLDKYLYRHTITGLTVGTKYYYRVRGVGSGTFYSAPASNATAVNFLAYGDSRGPSNGTLAPNFDNVCAKMIDAFTTDSDYQTFTLHAGDFVYTGGFESYWTNQYFNRTDSNIMDLQANLPMQGSLGNHETASGGTAIYRKYFPYYDLYMSNTYGCGSFDYGPVHIVVIDGYTNENSDLTAQQIQWIDDDLDNTTKEWKFLIFHAPGYSAGYPAGGGHENNTNVQDDIQPLCVTHGVDIVFNGHNHYYSRAVVNGVYHITTGGGGAQLKTPNDTYPYIEVVDSSHHFCTISIDGDDLDFVALDIDDNEIDSFEIEH